MIDRLKSVGQNSAHLVAGSIVMLVLGVITNGLLARGLGVANLGILIAIQAYVMTVTKVVSIELWQPVVKYGAEATEDQNKANVRRIFLTGLAIDTAMACIAGILALVLARYLSGYFDFSEDQLLLSWIYCVSIFFSGSGSATGLLRLKKLFWVFSVAQVAGSVVACIVAVALYLLEAGLLSYVVCFSVVNALRFLFVTAAAIVTGWDIISGSSSASKPDAWRSVALKLWRFGRVTWVSSTITALRSNADIFILGGALGASEIGLYGAVKRLASPLGTLAQHLRVVVFSEYSEIFAGARKKPDPNDGQLLVVMSVINLGISLASVLLAYLLAEILIGLIFGTEFLPAKDAFVALVAFFAVVFMNGNWTSYLVGRDGPAFLIWVNSGAFAITVAGSFLLLNDLGMLSVAVANILGSLFTTIVCIRMLRKELRLAQ